MNCPPSKQNKTNQEADIVFFIKYLNRDELIKEPMGSDLYVSKSSGHPYVCMCVCTLSHILNKNAVLLPKPGPLSKLTRVPPPDTTQQARPGPGKPADLTSGGQRLTTTSSCFPVLWCLWCSFMSFK